MPFNEATFWIGLTVAGTGLYFLIESEAKRRLLSLALTLTGTLIVVYSVQDFGPRRLWISGGVAAAVMIAGLAVGIRRRRPELRTGHKTAGKAPKLIVAIDGDQVIDVPTGRLNVGPVSLEEERRRHARNEFDRLTRSEQEALRCLMLAPRLESSLRACVESVGLPWSSNIASRLELELVSHDFHGSLSVRPEYRDAVQEILFPSNPPSALVESRATTELSGTNRAKQVDVASDKVALEAPDHQPKLVPVFDCAWGGNVHQRPITSVTVRNAGSADAFRFRVAPIQLSGLTELTTGGAEYRIPAHQEIQVTFGEQRFKDSPLAALGPQSIDIVETVKDASVLKAMKRIHAREPLGDLAEPTVWPVTVMFDNADGEHFEAAWELQNDKKNYRVRLVAVGAARPTVLERVPVNRTSVGVWCGCDSESAYLYVKNDGPAALFYATYKVDGGPVTGLTGSEFAAWMHANETKTMIPRGVTFKARLATLEWNHSASARWSLVARNASGPVPDARAQYSSCATSSPITRAPTLRVSGLVIAEPDLPSGPVAYQIALSAFGCMDQNDQAAADSNAGSASSTIS